MGEMKILVVQDTVMKYDVVQSSTITSEELKFSLTAGQTIEINWYREHSNHYICELKNPINGRYNWCFFKPHVKVVKPERGKIEPAYRLEVPYYSQRDNIVRPHQTCNMTCCAMVVEYYYPGTNAKKEGQLEDEMTLTAMKLWGYDSIYYHSRIVDILDRYGVKSVFSTTTPVEKMKQSISEGNPVIYSGKFTRSGHIIILVGYDERGFIVHDPYGEWFASGYRADKPGDYKHYSYNLISAVSYSGEDFGWAHLTSKK